jgi:maleate isomerase
MGSDRLHIALIVPASNTVMEPDFHRNADPTWAISTWRIFLESVTRDAEVHMMHEELPRVVTLIETTTPHLVVFGCTSAGSLGGLTRDREVTERIERDTGAKAATVIGSMVRQLRAVSPEKVAVFTPYREELTHSVADCIAEAGYEVVAAEGMGIVDNREIGNVTPQEIIVFVRSHMAGVETDCVFLSCTNWRAIEAIEPLALELGLPVTSSNHATLESVREFAAATLAAKTHLTHS